VQAPPFQRKKTAKSDENRARSPGFHRFLRFHPPSLKKSKTPGVSYQGGVQGKKIHPIYTLWLM
jgi:hypothetical protein